MTSIEQAPTSRDPASAGSASVARPAARTVALVGLGIVLVVGIAVRLVGIDFGRPFAYHADEWIIARSGLTMVHNGDWNPHVFWYPSLLTDLHAGVIAVMQLLGGPTTDTSQAWLLRNELDPVQFPYLLAGRFLVLVLAMATVVITFEIGRRLAGWGAALVAAGLLASMPLHIESARFVTTDAPVALPAAATLLASILAVERGRERWWIAAGIFAGLAASTKWNGAVVALVPAIAYLLQAHRPSDVISLLKRRTPWLVALAALVAFVVTTPAIVLDLRTVESFLRLQARIYGAPLPGDASPSAIANLTAIVDTLTPIGLALAIAGLVAMAARPRRRVELTVPLFVGAYLLVASYPPRHYDRNLLPILPYLAVAIGVFAARAKGWLAGRAAVSTGEGYLATVAMALGITAIAVVIALGWVAGVRGGIAQAGPDSRTLGRDWLLANVPLGTSIARERYTSVLRPEEFPVVPSYFLADHPLDWYRDQGVRLLLVTGHVADRVVSDPAVAAWYEEAATLPEIAVFRSSGGARGPEIRILDLGSGPLDAGQ